MSNKQDVLYKAVLNGEVAICACDVTQMVEEARRLHETMPVATIALGRTLAATTMMCSMLKNEQDKLTLTINGGGPSGTIMVTGNAQLEVKGYIANPDVNPEPTEGGDLRVGDAVGKDGTLTVVKDLGMREPYIGKVELVSGEIGEDVAQYFLVSEQQNSIVYVNTWLETDLTVLNAGGVIVRPLPGCSEETLQQIEARILDINNFAIYSFASDVPAALDKIFHGMELKLLQDDHPRFVCDCSRERLKSVLLSLGKEELEDMIEKDGGAQLTCRFCNKVYDFDAAQLRELLDGAMKE